MNKCGAENLVLKPRYYLEIKPQTASLAHISKGTFESYWNTYLCITEKYKNSCLSKRIVSPGMKESHCTLAVITPGYIDSGNQNVPPDSLISCSVSASHPSLSLPYLTVVRRIHAFGNTFGRTFKVVIECLYKVGLQDGTVLQRVLHTLPYINTTELLSWFDFPKRDEVMHFCLYFVLASLVWFYFIKCSFFY